jgi:hypothetical protein
MFALTVVELPPSVRHVASGAFLILLAERLPHEDNGHQQVCHCDTGQLIRPRGRSRSFASL